MLKINTKVIIRFKKPSADLLAKKKQTSISTKEIDRKSVNKEKEKSKSPNMKNKTIKNTKQQPPKAKMINTKVITQDSISDNQATDNINFTIFTSNEPSGTVICSMKPIAGRLINSSFISEKDLFEHSFSLLKDASLLSFDQVYNLNSTNKQLYSDLVKLEVSNLFQGVSSSYVFFGPTDSGKSYTVRGGDSNIDKGLLNFAIKDILNLIEIGNQASKGDKKYVDFYLKLSIYQIFNDKVNDLLSKDFANEINAENIFVIEGQQKVKKQIIRTNQKQIKNIKDIDLILKESHQTRKLLSQSMKINDLKKKAITVYSLSLEKKEGVDFNQNISEVLVSPLAKMDFMEMPSSNFGLCSSNSTSNQGDSSKIISKVFNQLAESVVNLSNGCQPKGDTKLNITLRSTLKNNSNLYFLTTVDPIETPLGDSFQALKYTNWMRNQIKNNRLNSEVPIQFTEDSKNKSNNKPYKDDIDEYTNPANRYQEEDNNDNYRESGFKRNINLQNKYITDVSKNYSGDNEDETTIQNSVNFNQNQTMNQSYQTENVSIIYSNKLEKFISKES